MEILDKVRTEELVAETKRRFNTKEPLIFKGTTAEWNALSAEEQDAYSVKIITDDGDTGDIADTVESGNLNAVTSNAVFDAVASADEGTPSTVIDSKTFTTKDGVPGNSGSPALAYTYTLPQSGTLIVNAYYGNTGSEFSELLIKVNGTQVSLQHGTANWVSYSATMYLKKGTVVEIWTRRDAGTVRNGTLYLVK